MEFKWKFISNFCLLSQAFKLYRRKTGLLLGSMWERGKCIYNREREKFPLSKLNKSSFLINFLCVSLSLSLTLLLYAQRINFEMAIKFIINSNAMAIKISFCIAINADYFVTNFFSSIFKKNVDGIKLSNDYENSSMQLWIYIIFLILI